MKPALRPDMLDGNGAVYEQIKRAVALPILRGDWPPGSRLPSEHELMQYFGTARMTVNRALTALAAEGLIVRRRRAGTVVAAPTAQHPVLQIHDIRAEVQATGRPYRFETVERLVREATASDCARLALKASRPVLAMSGSHFAGAVPFAFEDRLINLEAVPSAELESFAELPPGTWLLQHVPWSEASHCIRAVSADARVRRHLELPKDVPSLLVERRTRRGDMPVTAVELYYPGDRHALVANFSPQGQNGGRHR